jgi:hypothetical protein
VLEAGVGVVVAGVMAAAVGVDAIDSRDIQVWTVGVLRVRVFQAISSHVALCVTTKAPPFGTVLGTFFVCQLTEGNRYIS